MAAGRPGRRRVEGQQQEQLRGSLAYYHFDNIAGKRSSPCSPWNGDQNCDTDWSRPAFMQKGNTLFLLRDIMANPANPGATPQPQFVGLASKFDLLDVNLRWDTRVFDGLGLRLNGNYIRNLAYSKGKIWSRSQGHLVNNFNENGEVQSGPNAWMLQATLGRSFDLKEKGDWLAFVGYKYIQPDALPDGFNDSSFHQGGTNARGYYIGGSYAFDKNVYGVLRWMSTRSLRRAAGHRHHAVRDQRQVLRPWTCTPYGMNPAGPRRCRRAAGWWPWRRCAPRA